MTPHTDTDLQWLDEILDNLVSPNYIRKWEKVKKGYTTPIEEAKTAVANKLASEVLEELKRLEANSDCIDDGCGLDSSLLVDNLLRRIRELEASTTQSKPV